MGFLTRLAEFHCEKLCFPVGLGLPVPLTGECDGPLEVTDDPRCPSHNFTQPPKSTFCLSSSPKRKNSCPLLFPVMLPDCCLYSS